MRFFSVIPSGGCRSRGTYAKRFSGSEARGTPPAVGRGRPAVLEAPALFRSVVRVPSWVLPCHPESAKDLLQLLDARRLDLHRERSVLVRIDDSPKFDTLQDPSSTQDDNVETLDDNLKGSARCSISARGARLSPVWHSGRNPQSDRMRHPPSLAGSERGEIKAAAPSAWNAAPCRGLDNRLIR